MGRSGDDRRRRPDRPTATTPHTGVARPGHRAAWVTGLQHAAGNAAVVGLLAAAKQNTRPPSQAGDTIQRSPGDLSATDLLLTVQLGKSKLMWDFPVGELSQGTVDALRADPTQISQIEVKIAAALRDDAGPVHESQVYLEGPAVADDLRRDVIDWPAKRDLARFAGRIAARAAAVRSTKIRYPLEQSLEASGTASPGDIDWRQEVAALRGHPPGPDKTMIDASRADRFELALTILEHEATGDPQPPAGVAAHPDLLGPLIFAKYAATDPAPSELATEEMTKTHSEAFLATWLPTIRDTRLVPDDFDPGAFAPTGDLDAVRAALVTRYVSEAAPRTMEKFLLDRWTTDPMGRSPETFVKTADIAALRGQLLEHLAKDFPRWAVTQPGFRGAFWSDVGQRAAFSAVSTLVLSARGLQSFNAGLADRFASTGPGQLTPEEFAIAQDPYGYSQRVSSAATITMGMVEHLKPGDLLEHGLLSWYTALAASWAPGTDDAKGVAGLMSLLQGLGGLKSAIEAQQTASEQQIARELDTGWENMATIIRDEATAAQTFLSTQWEPMLKAVALEQITKNRDEMKEHLTKWPEYRAQAVAKFQICGHLLTDMIDRLQSGDIDSVELDGQVLTAKEIPELTTARDFMQGQADILGSDEKAQDQKDDMQEAIDGFEDVREKILSGEYKPIDYTKAVYNEARQRLGITWYEDYVSLGAALDRWAIVPENPFLAYAIARWEWEAKVAEMDHQFKVFIALGLLTVASLVVPGVAGVVLAGIDLGVGIAQGVAGVTDAYALLDLARLDTKGTVRGVSVDQAKQALHTAWIGLGLNLLLVGGLGTLWARLVLKGRGAAKIPAELNNLSALVKVNPVAAEKMIGKVKDVVKLEELLTTTGDSMLLERMLDKTGDIRHLEYALMHGDPRKIGELIDLAGDAGKLGKILDSVPDAVTAERLLRLTDDAEGLGLLLKSADNPAIAEQLLGWTNPRLADQMLGVAGDQGELLRLSRSGMSPETAARCLAKTDDAAHLNRLVARMDKGAEQVGVLLEGRSTAELEELLNKGIRPSEVEMGVGTPRIGAQPNIPDNAIPLPPDVKSIVDGWGLGDRALLQKVQPHEVDRLRKLGNVSKKINAETSKKLYAWAADGAKTPGDFANRVDFMKLELADTRELVAREPAKYPGRNYDDAAAAQLASEKGIEGLTQVMKDQAQAVRDLAGIGWADLGAPASEASVRAAATRLTFGSDSATYHVGKHLADLGKAEAAAPGAGLAQQSSAYLASARRTVAEGNLAVNAPSGGVTKFVFSRTVEAVDGTMVKLDTIVYARDNFALIASHMKGK